jgi:hypothetical protein
MALKIQPKCPRVVEVLAWLISISRVIATTRIRLAQFDSNSITITNHNHSHQPPAITVAGASSIKMFISCLCTKPQQCHYHRRCFMKPRNTICHVGPIGWLSGCLISESFRQHETRSNRYP